MGEPELIWDVQAELGEGPAWDEERRAVWFVDVKGRKLHCYSVDDGAKRTWDAPDQIGFALPGDDGSLICGVRGGLYRFDPDTGAFHLVLRVERDRPQNRLNDGFTAPDGSLWFGTMDNAEKQASGALYRYGGGEPRLMDDGYIVTNGPALSPDGRTLYHNDTLRRSIFAYDHLEGSLSRKRLLARVPDGYPDGLGVDRAGTLYVGLFNGWGIACISPSGLRTGSIRFPVQTVTKAAFAGDDLRDLYCTTAWFGNAHMRQTYPTLGGLYRVRVDVPGLHPSPVALRKILQ